MKKTLAILAAAMSVSPVYADSTNHLDSKPTIVTAKITCNDNNFINMPIRLSTPIGQPASYQSVNPKQYRESIVFLKKGHEEKYANINEGFIVVLTPTVSTDGEITANLSIQETKITNWEKVKIRDQQIDVPSVDYRDYLQNVILNKGSKFEKSLTSELYLLSGQDNCMLTITAE